MTPSNDIYGYVRTTTPRLWPADHPVLVCGFPGVGKTHVSRFLGWQDSDSSGFSKLPDGTRNPQWPRNYVEHLMQQRGVVLVSTHQEVRDALADAGMPFILVYPGKRCKGMYLQRYQDRGSPQAFIDLMDKNWDDWIDGLASDGRAVFRVVLDIGAERTLADAVPIILGYAGEAAAKPACKCKCKSSRFDLIRQWGQDKGITGPDSKGTVPGQMDKLLEELIELLEALHVKNDDATADAIGDMIVVLTLLAELIPGFQKHSFTVENCIDRAYNEIKGRTGKMVNGTFVKDR